jgi:GNAT superfamily N-acetyltransferase
MTARPVPLPLSPRLRGPAAEVLALAFHQDPIAPMQQGQGIGSALLQPVLARADAHRLPCYLETGVARNVPFYERHGFQVVAEGILPRGGPPLWAMVRVPRGA